MGCASSKGDDDEDSAPRTGMGMPTAVAAEQQGGSVDLKELRRLSKAQMRAAVVAAELAEERAAVIDAVPTRQRATSDSWGFSGGAAIERLVGITPLVDLEWVIDLIENGGVVPRRQEVPAGALITSSNVWRLATCNLAFRLAVLVLSYPWLNSCDRRPSTHPNHTSAHTPSTPPPHLSAHPIHAPTTPQPTPQPHSIYAPTHNPTFASTHSKPHPSPAPSSQLLLRRCITPHRPARCFSPFAPFPPPSLCSLTFRPIYPASPHITPHHPASPRIIPHLPASPHITPHLPASPRVTLCNPLCQRTDGTQIGTAISCAGCFLSSKLCVPARTKPTPPLTALPLTGHRSPLTDHRSPITDHCLLLSYHLLLTLHRSPLATHHSLFIAHCSLLTAHHSSLTARRSPPQQHLAYVKGNSAKGHATVGLMMDYMCLPQASSVSKCWA